MALLHPMHLALVALAVLLVFGPRKLPELAKGVGEAMKELKQTLHAGDGELASATRGRVRGMEASVTEVLDLGSRADG
jgi:sec-independent protein translocase protein TatA